MGIAQPLVRLLSKLLSLRNDESKNIFDVFTATQRVFLTNLHSAVAKGANGAALSML